MDTYKMGFMMSTVMKAAGTKASKQAGSQTIEQFIKTLGPVTNLNMGEKQHPTKEKPDGN